MPFSLVHGAINPSIFCTILVKFLPFSLFSNYMDKEFKTNVNRYRTVRPQQGLSFRISIFVGSLHENHKSIQVRPVSVKFLGLYFPYFAIFRMLRSGVRLASRRNIATGLNENSIVVLDSCRIPFTKVSCKPFLHNGWVSIREFS